MRSQEIRNKITALEDKLREPLDRLDSLIEQFLNEIVPAVQDLMDLDIKERIMRNAVNFLELPDDRISQIRKRYDEVEQDLVSKAEDILNKDQTWPHRSQCLDRQFNERCKRWFDAVARHLIMSYGTVLEEGGLLDDVVGAGSQRKEGKWHRDDDGNLSYVGSLPQMVSVRADWCYSAASRHADDGENMRRYCAELKKAEALERWDAATGFAPMVKDFEA